VIPAGVVLLLLALWRGVRRRWLVVTVEGVSMRPTYSPGDRLLVRRGGLGALRRGQAVVVTAVGPVDVPAFVKRVAALPGDPVPAGIPVPDRVVPPGRLLVVGDNPAASHDSRAVGYFPASSVVGVVLRPVH
jgi:signal peptidase I